MIHWAPFLHFYQPPTQFHAILKKICNEAYRPLIKMFLDHPPAKVTINICGVLTELFNDHNAGDILDGIKQLASNKQLEFVDSAKYHAILPLIPQKEAMRQIELNRKTNEFFFKDVYKPRGFFPPEMCYSNQVAGIVKTMGYDWILISGIACQDTWPLDYISKISCSPSSILAFYRDDILSNKISFQNLDGSGFIRELVNLSGKDKDRDIYVITAMDAETFGHHIQNWEKIFLEEVYETIDQIEDIYHRSEVRQKRDLAEAHGKIFTELKEAVPHIEVITISELIEKFPARSSKSPNPSSWSTSKEDIARKNYYPLWKDLDSRIHQLQWEHIGMCFKLINQALSPKGKNEESSRFAIIARGLLDRAIHSCQFWWANKNRGTWDINLVNMGLMLQEEAILNAYKAISVSSQSKEIKRNLYHRMAAARDIANKIRDLLVTE